MSKEKPLDPKFLNALHEYLEREYGVRIVRGNPSGPIVKEISFDIGRYCEASVIKILRKKNSPEKQGH